MNRERNIIRNIRTVSNIILLIAAIVTAVMVLTGCSPEPETYQEAEAKVAEEMEAVKAADPADEAFESFKAATGELDGSMLEGYIDKIKQFDYEIVRSVKVEGDDKACIVTVRITTFDFANEYLKAWNEYMTVEEGDRWQSQFYSHLLLRLASVSNKDYVSDIDVTCTDPEKDGNWQTDVKSNEELMNAISGGMLNEIKSLMTDDVVMDETEVNN